MGYDGVFVIDWLCFLGCPHINKSHSLYGRGIGWGISLPNLRFMHCFYPSAKIVTARPKARVPPLATCVSNVAQQSFQFCVFLIVLQLCSGLLYLPTCPHQQVHTYILYTYFLSHSVSVFCFYILFLQIKKMLPTMNYKHYHFKLNVVWKRLMN